MRKILFATILVFFSTSTWAADGEHTKKYTTSLNYQLNAQNPDGTNPTTSISLSVSPSMILDDIHEFGGTISYTVNKAENTVAATTTEVSTTMVSGFYRFNFPLGDPKAKIPMIGYAGPQVGITSMKAAGESNSDPSAGAQVGINFMFSENLAVNFHIFQFDTVFADDTQLLITQSVGIKYYF